MLEHSHVQSLGDGITSDSLFALIPPGWSQPLSITTGQRHFYASSKTYSFINQSGTKSAYHAVQSKDWQTLFRFYTAAH